MADLRHFENLQPSQTKQLYQGNYIDFQASGFQQWSQQFLPEVYDQEINIYGNRTLSGFLKMVSAEEATTSDQIIWTESGRLHARYVGCLVASSGTAVTATTEITTSNDALTAGNGYLRVQVPPAEQEGSGSGGAITDLAYRVGQTVMIQQELSGDHKGDPARPILKGIITQVDALAFSVSLYTPQYVETSAAGSGLTFTTLVYGSEYAKGTNGMSGTIFPTFKTYNNSPIIMKDHFALNGSDTSQVGWLEVESENGASGYLWYVKAEHENRLRWEDYMELSMLEAVRGANDTATAAGQKSGHSVAAADGTVGTPTNNSLRGTEGFFQALERRGNIWTGLASEMRNVNSSGVPQQGSLTSGSETGIYAFDEILKIMDRNGAIEENMLYLDRNTSLSFDDMLANVNTAGNATGTSWGVFNNSKEMALNLGFTGFRRGSYDFYKTDWKYLNDWSGRGGFGDLEGILMPAGTSTVYDEMAGGNVKRPFCHIRYRASEADNRKMKSWITGSVGGAYTNDFDEIRMHYLTERCIITQSANNFFTLKGSGTTTADLPTQDQGAAAGFNYISGANQGVEGDAYYGDTADVQVP